jgi:hypothetical protein
MAPLARGIVNVSPDKSQGTQGTTFDLCQDEHARVDELLNAARAMPASQRVVLMTRKGQIEDVLRTVKGP